MGGTCAHCELPLGRRPAIAHGARFCCYGCVLAWQVTRARGEPGAAATILVRLGLGVFFAMNVMMLSLPAYAPYVYGAAAGDGPLFVVLRVLALVFTVPVLVLLGGPILASAWRSGGASADGLIALGTIAAWALSVGNTVAGRPGVYFDTAAMLLVLVTLGRWLEARARADAGAAVRRTLAPAPALARRVRAGGREAVRPDALVPGDVVEVPPGGAFPTDGTVVAGVGGVDEGMLTGESRPVVKEPGAAIAGGTCSVDGLFRVRVTAPAAASAAARIAALVETARTARTAAERTADRVAAALVPVVVATAAVSAAWWWRADGPERAVLVALAVLVVACPCALGIATPVAVWTGLAAATRRGVIVREATVLERAAAVGRVVFDKTGTLTGAVPRLVAIDAADGTSADDVLACAAAVEAGLDHPIARAIAADAARRGVRASAATEVRAVPGHGIRARLGGEPVIVGSVRLAAHELGRPIADPVPGAVAVVRGGRLLGTLRFIEGLRSSAAESVATLRELGAGVTVLSGDAVADALVPALFRPDEVHVGLAPADKVAMVARLRGNGGRPVAMVGDGINDAPALAAADLGIAVASATDLARLTADVVLLGDDLRRVPWLLQHARRVRLVIRENLAWAFAYNAVAVGLAAAGRLNPLVASIAMLASSAAVAANARRLGRMPGDAPQSLPTGESETERYGVPDLTGAPGASGEQAATSR
jgi:heavy metal translocating P-type ATPase